MEQYIYYTNCNNLNIKKPHEGKINLTKQSKQLNS
jgi:hypothetical protein